VLIDKLRQRIDALALDLRGRTVLTEAASGAYVVTPVLAALAGARVFAYTKATRYGSVDEVFAGTRRLMDSHTGPALEIEFIDELTPQIIAQADVITNSGHLRPLDRALLQHAKDGLVIPLMYEAWEWRAADMDLDYVRSRGFALGATNERHPDIDVFSYLGDMAIKQILDAGLCLRHNRFVLVCNNDFGPDIARALIPLCAGLAVVDKDENLAKYGDGIDWLGGFPALHIPDAYRQAEAVIFTAYPFDRTWIGAGHDAPIPLDRLKAAFEDPFVLRYAGDVATGDLTRAGVRFFPAHVASGHMGVLPSAVGPDPIIRLQAGGLKAAEALLTGRHEHHGVPVVEVMH
jgi:hypothetical protein